MVLVSSLALLVVVAQQIGGTAPPSKIAQFWHLHDCELPCWAGIVLQQTSHEVAKERLLTLFGSYAPVVVQSSSTGFLIILHDSIGKPTGNIKVSGTREVVSLIALDTIGSDARQFMGVMQVYGVPTCGEMGAYTNNNDFTVMVDRPQAGTHITISQTLILTPILRLTIGAEQTSCRDDHPAWRGFTYR